MKILSLAAFRFPARWLSRVAAAMGLLGLANVGSAQVGVPAPVVEYTPTLTQVQGQLPVNLPYNVTIKSPNNVPVGATQVVTLDVAPTALPGGVAVGTAVGYLSFSNPVSGAPVTSLTFVGPGQTQTVRISVAYPANALPGVYAFKVRAVGWTNSVGLRNEGTEINGSVTAAATVSNPPEVVIEAPTDAEVISTPATSFPLDVAFRFRATVSGANPTPISAASADFGGATVTLTSLTGLDTTSVVGTGTLRIESPGQYSVTARATNSAGSSDDTNGFRVVTTALPPTVAITAPSNGEVFTYRAGGAPVPVIVTFSATSNFGGIRTLSAKINGAAVTFAPNGIGTLLATGSIPLQYSSAGVHTIEVTTTDDYGTDTKTATFSVNVVSPTPTISIASPTATTLTLPAGATTMSVPFNLVSGSNNGFFVDEVAVSFDNGAPFAPATTGLGTAAAVSTGTLTNVGAGTHTLTATVYSGGSARVFATRSVTFTVASSNVPPSVVINSPAAGATFTRVAGGPALSIPLTFTGTSNVANGVITNLKATLNGSPLAVTFPANQKVSVGSATLTVTNAGTYTIGVTATDAIGTATATRTFTVAVVQGRTISGDTFFDIDFDGREDCGEFGLGGITVRLLNSSNQVIATDVSDACGNYSFCNLAPGTYIVAAVLPAGLSATTLNERTVTISGSNVCVPDFGFGLNFNALRTMTANGNTIGYWKNNLDKAIAGKTNGIQVSKSTLTTYTCRIADFALDPYDGLSLKAAASTMGYSGSSPTALLSKQLVASEYNYQQGAYLNGNRTLTMLFLWWGEYVLKNPSKYSTSYVLWAKDWFDAYNNSHGGVVNGPAPR
ncbi:MAG: hypothetical protein B9S34_04835 [Opitutia bacterium Tous-C1TDCM]|nr:MAG: hypothetical protein B9S34_04835 [Opitutae bacterium Tous-C1TDCM]